MSFFEPPSYPYYDFNDVRLNPVSRYRPVIERMKRAVNLFREIYCTSVCESVYDQSIMPDFTYEIIQMEKEAKFQKLEKERKKVLEERREANRIRKQRYENQKRIVRNSDIEKLRRFMDSNSDSRSHWWSSGLYD